MKKHIQFAVLLICMSSCLVHCKKDNSASRISNNGTSNKIKTEVDTENNLNDTIVREHLYVYDPQGRLTTDYYTYHRYSGISPQLWFDTITYSYGSNTLTRQSTRGAGTAVYPLNNQGLLSASNLSYDAQGYLIADSSLSSGSLYSLETYTIVNGNITQDRLSDYAHPQFYQYDYTFTSDIDNRDYGLYYQGKRSKNLISSEAKSGTYNTCSPCTVQWQHRFDSQGRVSYEQSDAGIFATYTYY